MRAFVPLSLVLPSLVLPSLVLAASAALATAQQPPGRHYVVARAAFS